MERTDQRIDNSCSRAVSALSVLVSRATIELIQKETPEFITTATVASKFARFESSLLQRVGNIAREDVQNTHTLH